MHEVPVPLLAHQLYHLEKLFEMKVLLIRHDVQALVKIVGALAVKRRREIPRRIQRRAVRLDQKTGTHAPFLQVDDLGAV